MPYTAVIDMSLVPEKTPWDDGNEIQIKLADPDGPRRIEPWQPREIVRPAPETPRTELRSLDYRLYSTDPGLNALNLSDNQEVEKGHWLVNAAYGRDMLKAHLQARRPDLKVSKWRHQPELNPLLEQIVDALGLRSWPKPESIKDMMAYLRNAMELSRASTIKQLSGG